jgi:hypothetical protein
MCGTVPLIQLNRLVLTLAGIPYLTDNIEGVLLLQFLIRGVLIHQVVPQRHDVIAELVKPLAVHAQQDSQDVAQGIAISRIDGPAGECSRSSSASIRHSSAASP